MVAVSAGIPLIRRQNMYELCYYQCFLSKTQLIMNNESFIHFAYINLHLVFSRVLVKVLIVVMVAVTARL